MNIIIAGSGIGGLTAALCLQRSGHSITLLERAASLEEIGAGIQCGANALHVLSYLGLVDELSAYAVRPERVEFRDYVSGRTLHQMELGQPYESDYGAPYLHLHRADLYSVLLSEVRRQADIQLCLNAELLNYVETEHNVYVQLSNGEELIADCLIGADGLNSTVRHQLLQNSSISDAKFTGNVAWRIVVPTERLGVDWMETIVSNFVGPDKHAVLYYLRNKQLANLVGVVENQNWRHTSWAKRAPWQELKSDYDGWHPTVQKIIDSADPKDCYRWALREHKSLTTWSSKRVTLLGDAAHATLPFMAAGAALAMEDSRILQRAIDSQPTLAAAFNCYQKHRIPRTAKIQSSSSTLGKLYHIKSRLLRNAAFKGIGLFGQRRQALLPEYNANTEPID